MHIRSSLFVNLRQRRLVAGLVAGATGCALLSGCVGNPFEDANAAYPTFASIPPAPKDVRPHLQYGQAANRVEKDAAAVVAATDPKSWTITNTEDFAAKARTDAGPVLPPASTADTEAFAREQKARATPPPPPPR
jgi:hypothetical protein